MAACALAQARPALPAVRLATLEWPPYTGQDLPGQGRSTAVVRAAFDAVGYRLHTGFYPWNRAVTTIDYRMNYAGYFPEYASARTIKQCALSDPIGSSRLGLAQLRQRPVAWDSLADLRPYRIGVVHGYINSEALDAAIAAGEQVSDAARDDAQNLRKLLGGRIDMAVIDAAVFAHLVSTDPQLTPHRNRLVFGQRILETKKLYVCFRQDAQGRQLRDLFNEGRRKARP